MRNGLALAIAIALHGTAIAKTPKEGEPAPDFTIKTVDNQVVTLSELRGQVVVINFWATWCGPCKKELPELDVYYRLRKENGLRVFAVTTEDSLPLSRLKPLAAVMAIPMVKGIRGPYAPVGGSVPTNFVIDRAGVVRYAKAGAFDAVGLDHLLVPLLNEPAPKP